MILLRGVCPHCGAPVRQTSTEAVVAGMAMTIMVSGCYGVEETDTGYYGSTTITTSDPTVDDEPEESSGAPDATSCGTTDHIPETGGSTSSGPVTSGTDTSDTDALDTDSTSGGWSDTDEGTTGGEATSTGVGTDTTTDSDTTTTTTGVDTTSSTTKGGDTTSTTTGADTTSTTDATSSTGTTSTGG